MKKVFSGENCGREAAVYLGRAGKNRYFGWTGPLQKNCPTALLGRAAFAAYEALPEAKPRRRDGSAIPSISITEGRRPPSAVGAQNERTSFRMSFVLAKHYNPDISNFRFAILKYCPTALLSRAAFAAYERFAGGKTSAEGWLCHPEHLNHRRAERALGPRSPKRKTRYKRVFLFGGGGESRTPVRKPFHGNFSGRRRLLRESCSPRSRHLRQAVTPEGQVSFMIHGRRKALPAHVHH